MLLSKGAGLWVPARGRRRCWAAGGSLPCLLLSFSFPFVPFYLLPFFSEEKVGKRGTPPPTRNMGRLSQMLQTGVSMDKK